MKEIASQRFLRLKVEKAGKEKKVIKGESVWERIYLAWLKIVGGRQS